MQQTQWAKIKSSKKSPYKGQIGAQLSDGEKMKKGSLYGILKGIKGIKASDKDFKEAEKSLFPHLKDL